MKLAAMIGILMVFVGMPVWADDDFVLAGPFNTRTMQVCDSATGSCTDILVPGTPDMVNQVVQVYLAHHQMLICSESGACHVVSIPLSSVEQSVIDGTGPKTSIRAVWIDTPTVEQWTKVYVRVFSRPVENGERWYDTLWFGHNFNNAREVSVVPQGTGTCNVHRVISTSPDATAVEITMDNYVCDPVPGAPIVTRLAVDVVDNECFNGGGGALVADPQIPLLLLHEERGLNSKHHGESLARDSISMCQPLP